MSDTFNHEADAWGSLNDDHDDDGSPRSSRPRCKFCGSTSVAWVHTGVRWRLFDEDFKNPHSCPLRATPADFDDLTK